MEVRRSVRVINAAGLHARPCHAIVSLALTFEAELRVGCGGLDVNGKSILELMTLAASRGDQLELLARGLDAGDLIQALSGLFESGFEEV